MQKFLLKEKADIVIANVLNSYWVVDAAHRLGIPSIWWIHESYDYALMKRNIDSFAMQMCEDAFEKADVPIAPFQITSRVAFKYALNGGQAVSEFENGGKADQEIKQFWKWIQEQII